MDNQSLRSYDEESLADVILCHFFKITPIIFVIQAGSSYGQPSKIAIAAAQILAPFRAAKEGASKFAKFFGTTEV